MILENISKVGVPIFWSLFMILYFVYVQASIKQLSVKRANEQKTISIDSFFVRAYSLMTLLVVIILCIIIYPFIMFLLGISWTTVLPTMVTNAIFGFSYMVIILSVEKKSKVLDDLRTESECFIHTNKIRLRQVTTISYVWLAFGLISTIYLAYITSMTINDLYFLAFIGGYILWIIVQGLLMVYLINNIKKDEQEMRTQYKKSAKIVNENK